MAKEKKDTDKAKVTPKTKKSETPSTIDTDKSFSDRDHGRTHDSPKTRRTPKTL